MTEDNANHQSSFLDESSRLHLKTEEPTQQYQILNNKYKLMNLPILKEQQRRRSEDVFSLVD